MTETTTSSSPPPWRGRRIARLVGWIALGLAAPIVCAGILLHTSYGLRLLAPALEGALADAVGGTARIEGISGSLWDRIEIDRFRLEGTDGLSVEADRFALGWSPLSLLGGQLNLDAVEADRLSVALPASQEADPAADSQPFSIPQIPLALRVGRIAIPDLAIGPAGAADKERFSLAGGMAVATDGRASVKLDLEPKSKAEDRVRLDAEYQPEGETLSLTASARFARDGVLPPLLGLQPEASQDISLEISGEGPLSDWVGQIELAITETVEFSGRLGLSGPEEPGLSLEGEAMLSPTLLEGTGIAADRPVSLALDMRELDDGQVKIDRLAIGRQDLVRIDASGTLDMEAATVAARFEVALDSAAAALADPALRWQEAVLDGSVEGPLAAPEAAGTLSIRDAGYDVLSDGDIGGEWRYSQPEDAAAPAQFQLDIAGQSLAWSEPTLGGLLGEAPSVAATVLLPSGDEGIRLAGLRVDGETLQVSSDTAETAEGGASLRGVVIDLADLSALSETLQGSARLQSDTLTWSDDGLKGQVQLQGDGFGIGTPQVDAILGPTPRIEGDLAFRPETGLHLSDLTVTGEALEAKGSLEVPAAFETMKLDLNGQVRLPEGVKPEGVAVAEPLAFDAKLEGPFAAPAGPIVLRTASLGSGGTTLKDVVLTTQLRWEEAEPVAGIRLEARAAGEPLRVSLDLHAADPQIRLRNIEVRSSMLSATGQLSIPAAGQPIVGGIRIDQASLAALTRLAAGEAQAAGNAQGRIDLAAEQGKQVVAFDIDMAEVRAGAQEDALRISRVALDGRVVDPQGARRGNVDLNLSGFAGRGGRISIALELDGNRPSFTIEADGGDAGPLTLSAAGSGAVEGEKSSVTIQRLSGTADGVEFKLLQPATLSMGPGTTEARAALGVAEGRIDVAYSKRKGKGSATLDIEGVALQALPVSGPLADMRGVVRVAASLQDSGKGASGTIDATIDDFQVESYRDAPRGTVKARLRVAPQQSDFDIGLTSEALKDMSLQGTLPLRISLLEPGADLPADGPISAALEWQGPIEPLWAFAPLPVHALSGQASVDAQVRGTLARPRIDGTVELSNGRYEHLEYGTVLNDLRLAAVFRDGRLEVQELTANDGAGGTLTGSGRIAYAGRDSGGVSVTLKANDYRLVYRDDLEVRGNVDAALKKDVTGSIFQGRVDVNRAEVDLNAALPPSVPTLDVVRADAPPPKPADPKGDKPAEGEAQIEAPPLHLDLTVNMPDKVFIRGKGLDSEWGGQLKIAGTASAPTITGEMNAIRGQLDVIGKRFSVRESEIRFTGGNPINPRLGIRAVHQADDLTVTVQLVGPANAPRLELSSTPSLPRSEILSRVLFDKSTGQLSPGEALQLAQVVGRLSGDGGGFDAMGTLRKFLGVDVLRLDTGNKGGSAVEAGTYIGDNTYIGATQGTTAESGGAKVEVDITPNIQLQSKAGRDGNKNVGVEFKWDY